MSEMPVVIQCSYMVCGTEWEAYSLFSWCPTCTNKAPSSTDVAPSSIQPTKDEPKSADLPKSQGGQDQPFKRYSEADLLRVAEAVKNECMDYEWDGHPLEEIDLPAIVKRVTG